MKNMKKSETGRSMIEMLGVLAIVGILSIMGIAGYTKAMNKSKISKTISSITETLHAYADLTIKKISDIEIKGSDAPSQALSYKFIDGCKIGDSKISSGYKACLMPMGESFIKVEPLGNNTYSYMYFVTLLPAYAEACSQILTAGWETSLPKEWWKFGKIWIGNSGSTEVEFYGQELTEKNSISKIQEVCAEACPSTAGYCTIVFDFVGKN